MSKILVIASTEHVLNFKEQFKKSGFTYDYLICQRNSAYDFGTFASQKISIDSVMVDFPYKNKPLTELNLETRSQFQLSEIVKPELKNLENIIFQNYQHLSTEPKNKSLQSGTADTEQIFYLDQVNDLLLNKKTQKVHLEIKNAAVNSYDHIYLEDSYLNLSQIQDSFKKQNFFKYSHQQLFQFVGLRYAINSDLGERKFWLMADVNYNSIYDNFYYLQTAVKTIDIWTWIPVGQITNPTSINYLAQRIQKKIEKQFDFLTLSQESKQFLKQPINTALSIENKAKSLVSFIPHFQFYTAEQAEKAVAAINDATFDKLKIKKLELIQNQTEAGL